MKIVRMLLNLVRGETSLKKLQKRGLIVGKNFKKMGQVIIDPSHCWHIKIGDNVTMAPRVHILAHDTSTKLFLNHTKVANVVIGNNVFLGAGSIILPGVSIGDNVIIGAGSVVTNSIPDKSVAVGVPAKVVCSLDKYLEKERLAMTNGNTFNSEYTMRNPGFNEAMRNELLQSASEHGKIFVE